MISIGTGYSCGATQFTGIKPISRRVLTYAIAFTGESRRALLGEIISPFFPPSQVHSARSSCPQSHRLRISLHWCCARTTLVHRFGLFDYGTLYHGLRDLSTNIFAKNPHHSLTLPSSFLHWGVIQPCRPALAASRTASSSTSMPRPGLSVRRTKPPCISNGVVSLR